MARHSGIIFTCNYCDAGAFPHFKALLKHYWERHAEQRKRYRVQRNDKTATALVYATTKDEAAYAAGWGRGECRIMEIKY